MKNNMKKHIKHMGLLLAPLCLSFFSCSSSSKKEVESPYKTILNEISIVDNNGNEIKGKVDEIKKQIAFPRVDPESDLTAVQFKADMSEGAELDRETYDFSVEEGDSESQRIVKVVNQTRYREHLATIRLNVPVFGVDFEKAKLYDYSVNSGKAYEHFSSAATRASDFDGEHALIVSRFGGLNPHLISLEDIKSGNLNPIMLNTEGVSGGIFAISAGKLMQGRVYIANMAGNGTKIYCWDSPTSKAELIYENSSINPTGAGRYGDSMAMYLDKKGDGFIFLENNATNAIARIKVTNFKDIVETDYITPKESTGAAGGQFFSMTKIENTPYYFYTGFESPLMVVDEGGNLAVKVSTGTIPQAVSEAHVFEFNEKRYLLAITACRSGRNMPAETIYVYDITRGDDIIEALTILDTNNYKPVYQQTLMGSGTTAPGTHCNFAIIDDAVYLYGGATDAGFMVVEVPKNVLEDDF